MNEEREREKEIEREKLLDRNLNRDREFPHFSKTRIEFGIIVTRSKMIGRFFFFFFRLHTVSRLKAIVPRKLPLK